MIKLIEMKQINNKSHNLINQISKFKMASQIANNNNKFQFIFKYMRILTYDTCYVVKRI